jgi:ubiquinone/menaquinone biosynthesis C-methylase UbiE
MERRLLCGAEDMSEVETGSVDAVVGTMVFCNIGDIQKAYREIQRVLVPVRMRIAFGILNIIHSK